MNGSVLNLISNSDISGGAITKTEISLAIESSRCSDIRISGLNQETFEYFISNYGSRFEKIDFWKCPKIIDLSALESLKIIESVSLLWNNKTAKLWNMSKNVKLRSLEIKDFSKLKTLEELALANSLRELKISSPVHKLIKYQSLLPLQNLHKLEKLIYDASLVDPSIEPLVKLKNLSNVHFPSNLFTTEQIAWLKSRVDFDSPLFNAYIEHKDSNDVIVIGKRKPLLNKITDNNKLKNYVETFNKLVRYYIDNPHIGEPKQV